MGMATAECELNFGCLGMREVTVIGDVTRNFDNKLVADIREVWLPVSQRGQETLVNIYSEIAQEKLESLRAQLVTAYLFEKTRGREAIA